MLCHIFSIRGWGYITYVCCCGCVYVCVFMFVVVAVYVCVFMFVVVAVYVCVYVCVCVCMCVFVCMYVCVCTYVCVCMYVCVCVCCPKRLQKTPCFPLWQCFAPTCTPWVWVHLVASPLCMYVCVCMFVCVDLGAFKKNPIMCVCCRLLMVEMYVCTYV